MEENRVERSLLPNEKKQYNGKLMFYHPNRKGDGAAARFELRLNRAGEESYDCFFLEMAQQKSLGGREKNATFDWENKVTVKLGFTDICEFLMVLDGESESAGGDRGSIYHQSKASSTLIGFKRRSDGAGYFLGLSKKAQNGDSHNKVSLCMNRSEAIGLKYIFKTAIFFMTFNGSLQRY